MNKSARQPGKRQGKSPSRQRTRRATRRYEITIPRRDNAGNEFHPERINTVVVELNAMSGGYTRLPVKGGWRGGPEETNYLFAVDVRESQRATMFFRIYRALLEARFAQAEIYVKSYRVAGVKKFKLT